MEKEQIQNKLNIEYKKLGIIKINKIHEELVNPSKIEYIESIMDNIKELDIDEPIIVSSSYKLIDGYHRLKFHLKSNQDISVIVLDSYRINRSDDYLLDFLDKSVGSTIEFISDYTFVLDGIAYTIKENEGCGGCSNGWSSFDLIPKIKGKKMKIKKIECKETEKHREDEYDLYINNKLIAHVDTGWGNGYYGGDFNIEINY